MSSPHEFNDLLWEQTKVVAIGKAILREAEQQILSCESCTPDDADFSFDSVLDRITGCDPRITEYTMPNHALCPRCHAAVKSGYFRWRSRKDGGRRLFVRPATLVAVKNSA